ncbi:MAG: F0F1 ATP synthase subunit delta [Acidimicrobiales bacterium]
MPGGGRFLMHPLLKGYVHAAIESAVACGQLGEMLSGVSSCNQFVISTPLIFSVLTDAGISVIVRRDILRDLLAERVDPYAQRALLRATVEEAASDLPVAFGELVEAVQWIEKVAAEQSRLPADGPQGRYSSLERIMATVAELEEARLSRSASRKYLDGYCEGVLDEVDSIDELGNIQEEILSVAGLVKSHKGLGFSLIDRAVPLLERRGIMTELLGGRVCRATVRIAVHSLSSRSRDLGSAMEWLAEKIAAVRGWRIARIRSARVLSGEESDLLRQVLQDIAGRPVDVQVAVDSALLGGVIVRLGDLVVDSTARRYLEELGVPLLGREAAHQAVEQGMAGVGR